MKKFDIEKDIHAFCREVAKQKKKLNDWQFLHISVKDPENKLKIHEVEQFLDFHIRTKDSCLLTISKSNELLLFVNKKDSLAVTKFEKAVYENFSSDFLNARVRGFDPEGLEQFSKIIEPHMNASDVASYVAFRRMSRPGNCVFVVDDDPMVLKQLEKFLASFGHVVTFKEPSDLVVSYIQYAPDILFLDIHLGKAKGNEILKELKRDIDPDAHIVMVSSDTKQEMVEDIKKSNAKGFIVKPFNQHKVISELMRAPTIVSRTR